MSDAVYAPFDDEQVASLNAYQVSGVGEPMACPRQGCRRPLVATRHGWHCAWCGYRDLMARARMADWSWRRDG